MCAGKSKQLGIASVKCKAFDVENEAVRLTRIQEPDHVDLYIPYKEFRLYP